MVKVKRAGISNARSVGLRSALVCLKGRLFTSVFYWANLIVIRLSSRAQVEDVNNAMLCYVERVAVKRDIMVDE